MRKFLLFLLFLSVLHPARILFDLTKEEDAGNADWMIDDDFPYPQPPNPSNGDQWIGGISDWGFDLHSLGHQVVTLPPWGRITYNDPTNELDLANFDVFIVCEPQVPFTADEINAILNFVSNGGGLFMVADHNASDRNNNGWDSPRIWNLFENYFGIHFHVTGDPANSISDRTFNVSTSLDDPVTHGPTGIVHGMSFYASTVMTLFPSVNPSLRGHVWKTGEPQGTTMVFLATGTYGNGKIAGLTDSSPADDGTGNPGNVLYNGWTEEGVQNNFAILNTTLWLAGVSGDAITVSYTPLSPTPMDTVSVLAEYNFSRLSDTLFFSIDRVAWEASLPESTTSSSSIFKIPPTEVETTVFFFVRAHKSNGFVVSDTLSYQTRSPGNYLILDGWQLIQENSHRVFTFNGVRLPINSTLIIARGATQDQFENFWGVNLGENVVYINGGGRFPVLNGRETFTLVNATGDTVDGPTYTFQRGYTYQRVDFTGDPGDPGSWTIDDWHNASPGSLNYTGGGNFVGITEIADADTTGGYIYEFIEIFYGNQTSVGENTPDSPDEPLLKSNVVVNTIEFLNFVSDPVIYSVDGRRIMDFKGLYRAIDVSTLGSGVYLLHAGKKFIKFVKY